MEQISQDVTNVTKRHRRSVAVQTISKPVIYHGVGVKLYADERVRVHEQLRICLGCRSIAKTVTNNLPILSVLYGVLFDFCPDVNSPIGENIALNIFLI